MIRSLGHRFAGAFRAITPDPFVLAVGLTALVFVLAAAIEGASPVEILHAWQGDSGFFSLLAFAMQMVLILVTGHALAATPPVRRGLARLAELPRNGAQAAALVSFVAISAGLLNWGLGLIVGALLARDMGRACHRRAVPAHYPLLCAAGYSGMLCWHGGLSGSAPLKVTTEADVVGFLGAELGASVGEIPFTSTVLGPWNALITGGLWLLVPLLFHLLAPSAERCESPPPVVLEEPPPAAPPAERSLPDRIAESRWPMLVIVLALFAAFLVWLVDVGIAGLDPNALNLLFLALGLLLHGSLRAYGDAITDATRGAAGIVLQFPFYAGIMGVMRTTGLAATFSSFVAAHSPAWLFGVVTFLSAGLVNLFVPSGGGQWAVQGRIAIEVGQQLSAPVEQAVMAVAYGDQWTNMLQPFWALPLLAITSVRARDIIGYTALVMLAGGAWMMGGLLLWSAAT